MMTLIFGNFTQSFVNFTVVLNNAAQGNASEADLSAASRELRRVAGNNACYLAYLGQFS